jgi:hypothetical protein
VDAVGLALDGRAGTGGAAAGASQRHIVSPHSSLCNHAHLVTSDELRHVQPVGHLLRHIVVQAELVLGAELAWAPGGELVHRLQPAASCHVKLGAHLLGGRQRNALAEILLDRAVLRKHIAEPAKPGGSSW